MVLVVPMATRASLVTIKMQIVKPRSQIVPSFPDLDWGGRRVGQRFCGALKKLSVFSRRLGEVLPDRLLNKAPHYLWGTEAKELGEFVRHLLNIKYAL
jgi:hypothetical protein